MIRTVRACIIGVIRVIPCNLQKTVVAELWCTWPINAVLREHKIKILIMGIDVFISHLHRGTPKRLLEPLIHPESFWSWPSQPRVFAFTSATTPTTLLPGITLYLKCWWRSLWPSTRTYCRYLESYFQVELSVGIQTEADNQSRNDAFSFSFLSQSLIDWNEDGKG